MPPPPHATHHMLTTACDANSRSVDLFAHRAGALSSVQWEAPRAPGKWAPCQEAGHLILSYRLFRQAMLGEYVFAPRVPEERMTACRRAHASSRALSPRPTRDHASLTSGRPSLEALPGRVPHRIVSGVTLAWHPHDHHRSPRPTPGRPRLRVHPRARARRRRDVARLDCDCATRRGNLRSVLVPSPHVRA